MPVTAKQTRRYRGKELILLHRLQKVIHEITDHNLRYPQDPPPAPANRRHLEFNEFDYANMDALLAKSAELLAKKWPPPSST